MNAKTIVQSKEIIIIKQQRLVLTSRGGGVSLEGDPGGGPRQRQLPVFGPQSF